MRAERAKARAAGAYSADLRCSLRIRSSLLSWLPCQRPPRVHSVTKCSWRSETSHLDHGGTLVVGGHHGQREADGRDRAIAPRCVCVCGGGRQCRSPARSGWSLVFCAVAALLVAPLQTLREMLLGQLGAARWAARAAADAASTRGSLRPFAWPCRALRAGDIQGPTPLMPKSTFALVPAACPRAFS
jgi:hypothetical protein